MSKVSYEFGGESFCFETKLQYDSNVECPEFQLEEHLMMEIKEHRRHLYSQSDSGYIHNVVFKDDSGVIAEITDFIKLGNITIRKNETEKT